VADTDRPPAVYACCAIADLPVPHVASKRGRYCDDCGREVWFDPRSYDVAVHVARTEGNGEVVTRCAPCVERWALKLGSVMQ
jgi:hypothetical protein